MSPTGGRLAEIGNAFAGALFSCDASDIVFKCLTIRGVHNYDTVHLQKAIDFLQVARDRFPFGDIVGERVSLDEINNGLKIAESGSRTDPRRRETLIMRGSVLHDTGKSAHATLSNPLLLLHQRS
jgi:Zn-dependent alcohol dehydrogenase